jgi:flagellar biosynthesis protein FliR
MLFKINVAAAIFFHCPVFGAKKIPENEKILVTLIVANH